MVLSSSKLIGLNVKIATTAIIEDDVSIGDNTVISDYVIIRKGTKIGANNKIHSHVVIGDEPQDRSYGDENSFVEIGNGNIIREFVTIHKAVGEGNSTKLGDNNFLMVNSHLGHNVQVGSNCTLANNVALGGYVILGNFITMGGGAVVHQNCRIGDFAMMAGLSATNHDALPYMAYVGIPSGAVSTNRIGLRRAGYKQEVLSEIMRAYKIIYSERSTTAKILSRLEAELQLIPEIQFLIEYIKSSKRGIILNKFSGLS